MKICHDATACHAFPGLIQVAVQRKVDQLLTDQLGVIGDGGNSGFHATNIAVQFGARRLALVGFDMRLDRGVHWHGKHNGRLNNPTEYNLPRWRRAFDGAADTFRRIGVDVVNCSPVSALTAYPIASLSEALQC